MTAPQMAQFLLFQEQKNNGVDYYVPITEVFAVERGNAIVIGDTTSTISYQPNPFVTGDHIVVIRAPWINLYTGLFITTLLKKERYRYSYGRAFLVDSIMDTTLLLPVKGDGTIDWDFMESYIKSLNHKPLTTANQGVSASPTLGVEGWKKFRLGDLFEIRKGKRLTSEDQMEGDTPYIGAIDSNNGVANYIGQSPIHAGNTISLSYNGSVGEAFYQPEPFWATDDVNVLYFRAENGVEFNQYLGLFICTILRMEQYRYNYGRKWVLESMRETIIKLPSKADGTPNWQWIEAYIKALPYGDRIDTF